MSTIDISVYVPVIILMVLAVLIYGIALFASSLIAPKNPTELKDTPYECGEEPTGTAWSQFNVRFYVVGLIFIIFDVESVLMFPVASVFKKMHELGHGWYVFVVFVSFISVLLEGIAYCWKKGDLDWVKSYVTENKSA
ncbi:NADH-quinone oxidoreductase subunit A [Bacteriovoracaceae bacterium]|nr:NADH-quinone oxidoreductase subunit A [Bacteriovoracaceae bacterium]